MHRTLAGPLALLALLLVAGCRQAAAPTAVQPKDPAAARPATPKTKVIAYINVTSGCQADSVDLINKLGMDNADKVNLEIVDFGSPEGEERWRGDGLDCLTILFDGSPVVRFPDASGAPKTVSFFMPAGFSWTHQDLTEAFAAIQAGTLKPLTEEEARSEMEPKPITLKVAVKAAGEGAEVLLNGASAFTIKVADKDQSPRQRADKVAAALTKWAAGPVHPSEISLATAAGEVVLMAGGARLLTVTEADAKAAGAGAVKDLAITWLDGLKKPVVAAMPTGDATPAQPAANAAP